MSGTVHAQMLAAEFPPDGLAAGLDAVAERVLGTDAATVIQATLVMKDVRGTVREEDVTDLVLLGRPTPYAADDGTDPDASELQDGRVTGGMAQVRAALAPDHTAVVFVIRATTELDLGAVIRGSSGKVLFAIPVSDLPLSPVTPTGIEARDDWATQPE